MYLGEVSDMEAWSAQAQGVQDQNQGTLDQAKGAQSAPQMSPEDASNMKVGQSEIADLRAILSQSVGTLCADSGDLVSQGEVANGAVYPSSYQGRAQEIVGHFEGSASQWTALVDRMERDLLAATPDQVGALVAAIQALARQLHQAVDAAYSSHHRALTELFFRWEGKEPEA